MAWRWHFLVQIYAILCQIPLQRTTLKGCLVTSNSPLRTLHTSLKGLRFRGRALVLCSFTGSSRNPPSTWNLLITTNQPHSQLLFTAASSTAIVAAQSHWRQTKGRDSSWRAVQESLLPFITALKCLRVLKATLAPSHFPLTDVKAIKQEHHDTETRNEDTGGNGLGGYSLKSWLSILQHTEH